MKRWIYVWLCGFGLVWATACTPDMFDGNSNNKNATDQKDAGTTPPKPIPCKHDCDCLGTGGLLCGNGTCIPLRRISFCLSCTDGTCTPGAPCQNADGTVGTCGPAPKPCKSDCDCDPSEGVCHDGKCNPYLKRAYICPSCDDAANCPAGNPCRNADGSVGTCPKVIPCKHDCDCLGTGGLLCGNGTCIPLRRISFCLSCTDGTCTPGDPCQNPDGTVGTCKGTQPTPCKSDCDCKPSEGVCHQGQCNPNLDRAYMCPSCNDTTNCPAGAACQNADGSVGTCPKSIPCKHDCDCLGTGGLLCGNGTCVPLRRITFCLSCTDSSCTPGAPCQNADGTVGTCGTAPKACKSDCDCNPSEGVCHEGKCNPFLKRAYICPSCDATDNCPAGTPCRHADGSVGVCGVKPKACKSDCDCDPSEGVCHQGQCNPYLKRAYICPSCDDAVNCPSGNPCRNADGSVGTCPKVTLCKHDCDCLGTGGLLCGNGVCIPLRRISFCRSCTDGTCTPGDPCQKADGTAGICPAPKTFACGAKQCKVGLEYCSTVTGGAPPSCDALQSTSGSCPTGCHDAGLTCADGLKRCYCPSTSCNALPSGCTTCACLTKSSGIPANACQCQEQNGNVFLNCFAP